MKKQLDLFGKTFNQQVLATDGRVEAHDISPNCRIPAEIVIESIGSRVVVTAHDSEGRVLFRGDDGKAEKDAPARRIRGEVIFEPLGSGIRVTARDEEHRGSIGPR
jgi:hypothetical protein